MSPIPRISVITPSFNQAPFIEETLRSVNSQGYPVLEHIVMDGASTDGTVDLLKRYSAMPGWEYLRWISEPDQGQSDALNKGFRLATGDIIGWLNSDDIYEPSCFAKVSEAFEANPSIHFIYGDYEIVDGAGKGLLSKKEIAFDWDILLCGLNYIAQPNVFFRRRVFDEIGYLNESLHFVMDYEFWLRGASHGLRFQHMPHSFAACRWHMDAKTVSQRPRIQEELRHVRQMYWNKRHFGNGSVQRAYEKCWNLRARAVRQWRKVRTRHVTDFIHASLYLDIWKVRSKASASDHPGGL